MVEVNGVVVSFDVFKEKFLCDLDGCNGACCIEGDAGAPITPEEVKEVEALLPEIWDELLPEAREVIERQGISYHDPSGELVTSIVNGKDCVFTCYDERGCCYCAIERAYRQGRVPFYKPISCHLYPIRVGEYGPYRALNYNRWDVFSRARRKIYLSISFLKSLSSVVLVRIGMLNLNLWQENSRVKV